MEITTYKNLEETCYQILEVLQPEEGLTSFNKDNSGNVPGEKKKEKSVLREYAKTKVYVKSRTRSPFRPPV